MMQLEAQLRLCQSCLWCCKSALRLFSQSYAHRKAANYYDLLGIKNDATSEDIKKAFFVKSKTLHPDSDPANPALHSQFVELNEAYRVLSKELSRKEYDVKIRLRHSGGAAPTSTNSTVYRASPTEEARYNSQYWEQFRQAHAADAAQDQRQKRRKNIRLVGYCVLTMMISIGLHIVFFRKLEDIHTKFMDDKDRVIMEIYNESKEQARINGFKKQSEILRAKHAEFQKKYKTRYNREDK